MKWLNEKNADLYGFHGEYHDGISAVKYYNQKITDRRQKYPYQTDKDILQYENLIKSNGHCKIDNFFDEEQKNTLLDIKQAISDFVDNNENIKRRDDNMAFVNQPILNIPNLYKIVFNDNILKIVSSYFNCIPAITSIAVRKSFVTDAPAVSNQYFHRDYNSLVKLLKVIVYLNDVDENAGPFTYIQGSTTKMFDKWWNYHYLHDDILKNVYGEENIKYLTANFGDLLFADTRGFHKGLKPKNKERYAAHMCFMIHPELSGPGHQQESPVENWFKIKKEDYDSLDDWKKPVADFLIKV